MTRGASLTTQLTASAIDPRDLTAADISDVRRFLDGDLFAFAKLIFGYPDLLPSLHGDVAEWLNSWGMVRTEEAGWLYYTQVRPAHTILRDYRRIMTQIPREHYKTSLGTLVNALWQASRTDPDGVPGVYRPVAIFNERDDKAREWVRAIRDVIAGSLTYQVLYRDLLPAGVAHGDTRAMPRSWRWNDAALDLNGKRVGEVEPSIGAHGIESATTGGHWPKLILDDLISVKHKQSAIEMERAREWVKTHCALMRPAENSLSYVNCTPWTYSDIYTTMVSKYNYKVYRRSALEDEHGNPDIACGQPIAPNKFSAKQLRAMHARDSFTFSSQYMCLPRAGEDQSFNLEWVRRFALTWDDDAVPWLEIAPSDYDPAIGAVVGQDRPPRRLPLAYTDKCLILDPAPSEPSQQRQEPNARNAILAEAIDPWGRRFILETWAARAGYMEVINQCFKLADKWGIGRLRVEEVNFSNVYRHWIRREQQPGGRFAAVPLIVLPLKPNKRDKSGRILAREPGWREGLYYVNKVGCDPFLVEYAEFPNGTTVDLLDCMGYDNECLVRPERPDELALRHWIEHTGAPYSTGYYELPREDKQ